MKRSDRMAVIVMPRETLLDWVNRVTPDDPAWMDELLVRANVYFIPSYEAMDEAEEYLHTHFDEIFCNELAEWFEDEAVWPQPRTYAMFEEWFDVMYDVVVFDPQARPASGHRN